MMIQSTSAAAMEKALENMWQRGQLIIHNVANVDTPGFKAKRLSFETELQKKIGEIQKSGVGREQAVASIENIKPTVYSLDDLENRADGNNVNIDNEYIELARVQIQHSALVQKISGHYSTLKYALTGGR